MSSSEFEEFANVIATQSQRTPESNTKPIHRLTVLGGGDDGRMYSALGLAAGLEVTLFSAYGTELTAIRASGSITIRGEGPIGSYHVDQSTSSSIITTSALDDAVTDAEAIILTGPLHKQRTYSMVLAEHLQDGQILILPEARTFGALEMSWLLQTGGCTSNVTIVELSGSPYWVNDQNGSLVLSKRNQIPVAQLPNGPQHLIEDLRHLMPNLLPVQSCLNTAFSDGSAAVEIPAFMFGGPVTPPGGPAIPEGGIPLAENATVRNLIGPTQETIISKLWNERKLVANSFGIRNLPSLNEIIDLVAGAPKESGSRLIPSEISCKEALRSGVIGSLIPLISAAELAGIDVPITRAIVEIVMTVINQDLTGSARRLDRIGVIAKDIDTARKQIDNILSGATHG